MKTPTPGPWAISGIHHSIGIAPDDGKSDGIATVFGCGPKAEANARLISAAPELLQVAKDYVLLCQLHGMEGAVLKSALSAIAKAQGEAI